jgi:TNF receptor-associated protein 1
LTQRFLRFLNEQAREDEKKFQEFYNDFNLYFKEAIMRTTDQHEKEEIASLLRFETNKTEPGVYVTLSDYISRMKPDQKNIFFYAAPSRELAMNSPYFEAIKKNDYEVLFLFEPYDEMVIMQLNQFKKKTLSGIEQEVVTDKHKDDVIIEGDSRSLSNDEASQLKEWLKTTLGKKIKNVKITNKLDTHPCVVTTENMGVVRHLIKTNYFQREKISDFFNAINLTLEINPKNALIKSLYTLHKKDSDLAQAIAEQVTFCFYLCLYYRY